MSSKNKAQAEVVRRIARTVAMCGALVLAGCATAADPHNALAGKDLQTAVGLYGHYNEHQVLRDRSVYVWRRSLVSNGQPYACELRVEVAFRDVIRSTAVEGNQGVCLGFWVQFGDPDVRKKGKPLDEDQKVAKGCPDCRPVGRATKTASAALPVRGSE